MDVAEDDRAVAPEAGPDVDVRGAAADGLERLLERQDEPDRPTGPRARNATSGSYLACCLPPNAPPGSGAKTRTFASGSPSTPATTRCSQYGCWIELQTAMPSPSGAARKACGSMANWVTIGKA